MLMLDPHRGGNRCYPERQSAGGGVMILSWVFWFRASCHFGPQGKCLRPLGRSCSLSSFSLGCAFGHVLPCGNPRLSS